MAEKQEEPKELTKLPQHILLHIFLYLKLSDLLNVSLVSKQVNQITNTDILWEHLEETTEWNQIIDFENDEGDAKSNFIRKYKMEKKQQEEADSGKREKKLKKIFINFILPDL